MTSQMYFHLSVLLSHTFHMNSLYYVNIKKQKIILWDKPSKLLENWTSFVFDNIISTLTVQQSMKRDFLWCFSMFQFYDIFSYLSYTPRRGNANIYLGFYYIPTGISLQDIKPNEKWKHGHEGFSSTILVSG